jgi:hypothetical protein
MAYSQERAVVEHAQNAVVARTTGGDQLQCLIVASDSARRRWLANSAHDAGWFAFESEDFQSATKCHRRTFLQLVVVDLSAAGAASPMLRDLVGLFAKERHVLVVVCSAEGQPEEEIWARQLGVWLYLPGEVKDSDVTMLCTEARDLARRLAIARASPIGHSPAWRR